MRFILLPALVTTACTVEDEGPPEHPGIQVGDEGAFGCAIVSVTEVTDPAAVIDALGVSADDALAGLTGAFTGTGTTHDGATVDPLALQVAEVSHLAWTEVDPSCPSYLSATTTLDLDGGSIVQATLDATLAVSADQGTLLLGAAPYDEVQGTLEPLWLDPATLDWTELRLIATPTDSGWDGVIGFTGCNDGGECAPPVDAGGADAEMTFSVLPD